MKKITHYTSLCILVFILGLSLPLHAVTHTILVTNFSFSPQNLNNVALGDVIRWEYVNGLHTTTSSSIPAGAASWDHNNYGGATFYEYTPTVAGTYNYVCSPHASFGMVGSFTVLSAGPSGNTLSGFFRYFNLTNSGIPNATIQLKDGSNSVVATTTTNAGGAYSFTGIPDGSYTLHAVPTQNYSGVNSFDALLALRHFVGQSILTGVPLEVADVTNNNIVNSLDALVISRRFTGVVTTYATGDWYIETPTVNLSGNGTFNATFKACLYGDVNGSFIPN